MGGVDGLPLRGVHGGGVGQGEVLGDVGGGQHHPLAQRGAVGAGAEQRGDVEAAVVADGGDLVGLAVDRAAPVALDPARSQPLNRAWTRSPTPAMVPCEVSGTPSSVDPAEADEFGAQLRGQAGGLLVGVDEQQRAAPGEGVGQPARAADCSACSRVPASSSRPCWW